MSDSEDENYYDSDSSENEEQHLKFLNSVSQLDSTQRVKPASRKEISAEISEYNLQKGATGKNLVHVNELADVLKKKAKHIAISDKLKQVTGKSKTLPKPLEKPQEDRLKRIVGYEGVQKQIKRWNAVVERNSLKDQLRFPLNNTSMSLQDSSKFFKQFQTQTPLEVEMTKLLQQDKNPENETQNNEFPLTLEEMIEKRKEMARLRAKLSYQEAKAQRQNKIKSKKYHRILKHEKVRQQLKDFELLQKTDPSKALEKLEELDKNRALERASLRHRNTGKWAKNLTVKAKYDVESRKILAEQLKMSREMTRKVNVQHSSDEEDAEVGGLGEKSENNNEKSLLVSSDNPWSLSVAKEVQDFVSDYRKYWNEKNKEISNGKTIEKKEGKGCDVERVNAASVPTENDDNAVETGIVNDNHAVSSKKAESTVETPNGISEKYPEVGKKRVKKPKVESSKFVEKKIPKKTLNYEEKAEETEVVTVRPTSGIWVITTVEDSPIVEKFTSTRIKKTKRKAENMNALFTELEERLAEKAAKKAKKINSKLKKGEKFEAKKKAKVVAELEEKKLKLSLRGNEALERPDLDEGLLEGGESETLHTSLGDVPNPPVNASSAPPEIDPKKFIQIKPKLLGVDMPEYANGVDDAIDDEMEKTQQKMIEEAFGGDDVIAEFKKLKKMEEESNKVEISNSLPGWGEWGGAGVVPLPKRKRRRFITVKLPPRKDKEKVDIIINENENPNIKNHLVSSIPFPFTSAEAFESNIRAPMGREWVPETAHHRLIQRPIETKLGMIIEPMGEEEIVKNAKVQKSPYQGKKKVK